MITQLLALLDALGDVKILPRRASEADVLYGYVDPTDLQSAAAELSAALGRHGYEVHRCDWPGEIVLLALNDLPRPLAIRLTSSADERYNLYALGRPGNAQALWQWAQTMVRQQARKRRERRS